MNRASDCNRACPTASPTATPTAAPTVSPTTPNAINPTPNVTNPETSAAMVSYPLAVLPAALAGLLALAALV
eukprot:1181278-Prorocentrum_minimum.AAC.7